jgi:hypothetical protein
MTASQKQTIRRAELFSVSSNMRAYDALDDVLTFVPGHAKVGDVVLARVAELGTKSNDDIQPGTMEDITARFKLHMSPGDLFVAPVADRFSGKALFGRVPPGGLPVPSRAHLLCYSGVIGLLESSAAGMLASADLLGIVQGPDGAPIAPHLRRRDKLQVGCPLVLVAGTGSHVGKTTFAARLVKYVARHLGRRVGVAKLVGTGSYRDILQLRDAGAYASMDFVEAGLPTTYNVAPSTLLGVTKFVLSSFPDADLVVAEIGGDLLGAGVPGLLEDPEIRAATTGMVLVPSDVFGAYGARIHLKESGFAAPVHFGMPIGRNPKGSLGLAERLIGSYLYDAAIEEDLARLVAAITGWH